MRAVLPPSEPKSEVEIDVHAWYAADWVDRGGVRINFVASADGAASASGFSRGLQTPGDNRIFAALRDLADVVVAGAGTARTEGYRPIELTGRRAEARARYGLRPALPTAIVSGSLLLDPDARLFAEPPDGAPTIVITGTAGDPDVLAKLRDRVDLVQVGTDEVDLPAAVRALADRGFTRVLCEGGPQLFGALGAARLIDEVCLSVTPILVGPGPGRIVAGTPWPDGVQPMRLAGLLEEDGALFCRYVRFDGADDAAGAD
jgi:riboflavin biosynthesis pyrimidine reductase